MTGAERFQSLLEKIRERYGSLLDARESEHWTERQLLQEMDPEEACEQRAAVLRTHSKHANRRWYAEQMSKELAVRQGALDQGREDLAQLAVERMGTFYGMGIRDVEVSLRSQKSAKLTRDRRTAASEEREAAVKEQAENLRKQNPYDRQRRSTRWLARRVARELDESPDTVRGDLRRLGIQ